MSIPAVNPPIPVQRKTFRILYADDVHELRKLFEISLGHDGHQIETVADGNYALDRLLADPERYDLLITDHHMPRMTGLQLVMQLKGGPFKGKIVVFSSELDPAVAKAYNDLGVALQLQKPIYPTALREALAKL